MSSDFDRRFGRMRPGRLIVVGCVLAFALYLAGVPNNPPGFFVDETSIAYNAFTISQTGVDEHGEAWPLYFRAFGEYKNPVYIYLLAGVFKFSGPSKFAARALSACSGAAAALLLGFVAARESKNSIVGAMIGAMALLTPWLFEVSRLVFEVALLPLAIAMFLFALQRALEHDCWRWRAVLPLALCLALISYTSAVGRVLGPCFAVGLLLCTTRDRFTGLVRGWLLYGVLLIPMFLFGEHHPGALGTRLSHVTYLNDSPGWFALLRSFGAHYFAAFDPRSWLLTGDPEPRHHIPTIGSLLLATALLACTSTMLIIRRKSWSEPWTRFLLFGLLVSPIPAALTIDRFHTLRLIGIPIFLMLLCVPALSWLAESDSSSARSPRLLLYATTFAIAAQGAAFLWQFHRAGPSRWHSFDAFYPEVFESAIAQPQRPIYLKDNDGAPGYIHAYWYGLAHGMTKSDFVRLDKAASPPPGALVITCELPCRDCDIVLERASFRAYVAR